MSAPVRQVVGAQFARSGDGVALLHAGGVAPQPLGPLKQLRVVKGDTVDVVAYGMYQQPTLRPTWGFTLASFVAGLLQPPAPGLPLPDGGRRPRVLPLLSVGLALAPAVPQLAGGVPKAYVRVLVYNADSALVDTQTKQLTTAALNGYETLSLRVFVPVAGYVQAYVANESDTDVFFDDISVEYRQGLQVQENHYDPFGLDLVGVSRLAARPQNKFSWNGKEQQTEFGLNWHDHGWRFYDPQLARWVVTDPDGQEGGQESWTSYQFGMDNAVRYNDLDGRCPDGKCPPAFSSIYFRAAAQSNVVKPLLRAPVSKIGSVGGGVSFGVGMSANVVGIKGSIGFKAVGVDASMNTAGGYNVKGTFAKASGDIGLGKSLGSYSITGFEGEKKFNGSNKLLSSKVSILEDNGKAGVKGGLGLSDIYKAGKDIMAGTSQGKLNNPLEINAGASFKPSFNFDVQALQQTVSDYTEAFKAYLSNVVDMTMNPQKYSDSYNQKVVNSENNHMKNSINYYIAYYEIFSGIIGILFNIYIYFIAINGVDLRINVVLYLFIFFIFFSIHIRIIIVEAKVFRICVFNYNSIYTNFYFTNKKYSASL